MEIEKNVRIVYTKEALIDLVVANVIDAGYAVNPKNIKFLNKRGHKSDFKTIVIDDLIENPPLTEEEAAAIEIIKDGVTEEKKED